MTKNDSIMIKLSSDYKKSIEDFVKANGFKNTSSFIIKALINEMAKGDVVRKPDYPLTTNTLKSTQNLKYFNPRVSSEFKEKVQKFAEKQGFKNTTDFVITSLNNMIASHNTSIVINKKSPDTILNKINSITIKNYINVQISTNTSQFLNVFKVDLFIAENGFLICKFENSEVFKIKLCKVFDISITKILIMVYIDD